MDVTTSNITWCTPEMYISALATAGITDAKVVVAAPFEVSGTAALTGVYKAYEDMTGKKLDQKIYYHHTGYIGNMKEVKYSTLMKTKPEFAVELAVKGMLPDSTLGRTALTRLRVYRGAEHKHEAQKPEEWAL